MPLFGIVLVRAENTGTIPTYLSMYLPINVPAYLCTYLYMHLSIYLCTYLSIYVPLYLSMYLPIYVPIYLPMYLHTYLEMRVGRCVANKIYHSKRLPRSVNACKN